VRPVPAGGVSPLPAPLASAPLVVLGDLAVEPRPLTVSREELREVALAQRTLNQTRVAANQAQFDYRLSLFQLEQATGQPVGVP
jgi:hypothetical protein